MALARIYSPSGGLDIVLGDDQKWTGEPWIVVDHLNRAAEMTPGKSMTPSDPICASAHHAHEFLLKALPDCMLEMMYEPAPIPEGAMH